MKALKKADGTEYKRTTVKALVFGINRAVRFYLRDKFLAKGEEYPPFDLFDESDPLVCVFLNLLKQKLAAVTRVGNAVIDKTSHEALSPAELTRICEYVEGLPPSSLKHTYR